MELIERRAAFDAVNKAWQSGGYWTDAMSELLEVPVIEAEPIRYGIWYTRHLRLGVWCGRCGAWAIFERRYCPDCGAKMDGGDEHE